MTAALLVAGTPLAAGLLILSVRRGLVVAAVDGTSMEPALRSGDRVLIRRSKRIRPGQVVLFRPDWPSPPSGAPAGRDALLLLKRVVAVPGDRLPAEWADPDIDGIAGTTVPRDSFVVMGDNRPTSWDSRHYGFVPRERLVGIMIRRMSGPRNGRSARSQA